MLRKTLLALIVAVLLTSAAFAAPAVSPPSREPCIENRFVVTCDSVTKDVNIYVEYTVLSERNLVVSVEKIGPLFDDNGGRLTAVPDGTDLVDQWDRRTDVPPHPVTIGGNFVKEREIAGGVKTKIRTQYSLPDESYELAENYTRVNITINDKQLTFRDIPGQR